MFLLIYANWMHNGQGSGDTETGAYTIVGGQTIGTAPAKNVGATVWIPTENEWFKAAYYDPTHMSGAGGYWLYANRSNSMTSNDFATVGAANYYDGDFTVTQSAIYDESGQNYLTDAGAYGTDSQSYYGLNDMSGNVWEWNDLSGASDSSRGLRGGYWGSDELALRSMTRSDDEAGGGRNGLIGFRLASIPEPSAFLITVYFGAGLVCRRKR